MLKILPLLLAPAVAAAIAYWLTRSQPVAVAIAAIVLGAMLYIGITT